VWKTHWGRDSNEDEATAIVRFASGQYLVLSITQIDALPKNEDRGSLEITGTKGTYVFDQSRWKLIQPDKRCGVTIKKGMNPSSQWDRYYKNIAGHLVKGEKLVITPEWSRRPIHILDLACRSAELGKTIKAKYK